MASHLSEWLSSKRTLITNAGKDVEKRGPLSSVGGNVYWYSHCGKHYGWRFLKTLKLEIPYNPEMPLLGHI